MARHHHSHGHDVQNTNASRPIILRILSLAALLLPVIFYIIALAFSLKTLYEPSFALSAAFDGNGNPFPSADDPYTYKSGPFYNCNVTLGGSERAEVTEGFNQTCERITTLGAQSFNACLEVHNTNYDQHFCQKSTTSAQLFVSGTVLIGLALLLSLITALTGFKTAAASSIEYGYLSTSSGEEENGKTNHHHSSSLSSAPFSLLDGITAFLGTATALLAGLAAILIAAGQALGINAFIDTQIPSGIDSITQLVGFSGLTQSPWYWGVGAIVWPSVAWLAALMGVVIAFTGCGVRGR